MNVGRALSPVAMGIIDNRFNGRTGSLRARCAPCQRQVLPHVRTEDVSFQCTMGSPATGARKYGMRVPFSDPMYTVRRSRPPNVTLAIHGARPRPVANKTSSVTLLLTNAC